MVTSFDVRWPGDQLFKLFSGEESGKEEGFEYRQTLHFPKPALEINRLMIPAEVILLIEEAVVDVANEEGGGSLAEEILKVTCNRVKGLLLGSVY